MQEIETFKPGYVNMNDISVKPINFSNKTLVPAWQAAVKRIIDVVVALISLIILFPLLLIVAIITKLSSKGNIIFNQQRVGYKGKVFQIHKFRSMYADAEINGPALSSENDIRITNWGKTMRKWRLDELPQLWNIIKGEMSFVGPRPERRFYINEIDKRTPSFSYLLNVKPGLTSLGMVKFGYASSIDDMIERMKFDLEYVANISLWFDFKIMLYTFKTIFLGKGR